MNVRSLIVTLLTLAAPLSSSAVAETRCPSGPSAADRMASPCSLECDRKASECVDACEERYPEADKPRVECKVVCIEARRRCETDCK